MEADPYKCTGGYKPVLTGKKAKFPYEGVVYDIAEFNCCIASKVRALWVGKSLSDGIGFRI